MTPSALPLPEYASSADEATRLATEIKNRWRAEEESSDAIAVFRNHPSLLRFKSIAIDLAYEDYCLREMRGRSLDLEQFCTGLPAFRSSIRSVIQAHRLISTHPDLLVSWPNPGDQVEGVTVAMEIGRGGFARAYLAFDPNASRPCVLKLSPRRGEEGQTLGPLNHPHVTGMYWTRRVGNLHAVCLPLLGITTLEDARESVFREPEASRSADSLLATVEADRAVVPPPPPGRPVVVHRGESYTVAAVSVAVGIADALAYLHGHNLGHGDLKPSNVILGPDAHPYLIDFNLAATGGNNSVTVAGGTLPYMAPELLKAFLAPGAEAPALSRAKADVFAFGAVLYELLTGRLPWPVNEGLGQKALASELLARWKQNLLPNWTDGSPIPKPVARIIGRCLAAAPEDRPTATEIVSALGNWLAARRGRRKKRIRMAFGSALVLSATAVVAWQYPIRSATPLNQTFDPAAAIGREPQTADEYFARGLEHLRRNNLASAYSDLLEANKREPNARMERRILAYQAYALNRMGNSAAIDIGKTAIQKGATSAAVYNNIGCAYIQHGQHSLAFDPLEEAIRRSPTLVAARYNRAIARHLDGTAKGKQLKDLGCVDDIRFVINTRPESAEVYFAGGIMCAAGLHLDPKLRGEAIGYLREAVNLGFDPKRFALERTFMTTLRGDPEFDRFQTESKAPGPIKYINMRIVEPLED